LIRDAKQDLDICEKATRGPWKLGKAYTVIAEYPTGDIAGSDDFDYYGGYLVGESISNLNREFIAISREALPYWINRAMALEQELITARECTRWTPPND
jgi:hypothetical protein